GRRRSDRPDGEAEAELGRARPKRAEAQAARRLSGGVAGPARRALTACVAGPAVIHRWTQRATDEHGTPPFPPPMTPHEHEAARRPKAREWGGGASWSLGRGARGTVFIRGPLRSSVDQ